MLKHTGIPLEDIVVRNVRTDDAGNFIRTIEIGDVMIDIL
jgi:hypothetical protein